jgi:hypothetical protein
MQMFTAKLLNVTTENKLPTAPVGTAVERLSSTAATLDVISLVRPFFFDFHTVVFAGLLYSYAKALVVPKNQILQQIVEHYGIQFFYCLPFHCTVWVLFRILFR